MRSGKLLRYLSLAAVLVMLGIKSAPADDAATQDAALQSPMESSGAYHYGLGTLVLSGDAGYYTYSTNEVSNALINNGDSTFNGGMGYGASLKLGLTHRLAAKVGLDYLFSSTSATEDIRGVNYNTQVNLPATLLFIGGEYVLIPTEFFDLKVLAGYTLVSIYNGNEQGSNGNSLDLGSVTGQGNGFQAGIGLEAFLARSFALELDLAYDYDRITGATFTDPSNDTTTGTVDYSGFVAKLAFNIYLFS